MSIRAIWTRWDCQGIDTLPVNLRQIILRPMPDLFNTLTDAYEAMIDWPKRLANEEPFFRWLFGRTGARSILDVACGTGHHVNLFHSWNLRVEGSDMSEAMISRCRSRWGESDTQRWSIRRFDQPVNNPAAFDVVICIGNSLALVENEQEAADAIQHMLGAVRAGGAVVVQIVNIWRFPDGPSHWPKCTRTVLPQGDSLIIKGMHRSGQRAYIDALIVNLDSRPPVLTTESVSLLGIEPAMINTLARERRASTVETFGGYDRSPYDRDKSLDFIAVLWK